MEGESVGLPPSTDVELVFNEIADAWVFQKEEHEKAEGKYHYQCCVTTKIRTRKSTLLTKLSSSISHPQNRIRVDKMNGTWDQAVLYCTKEDSATGAIFRSSTMRNKYSGEDIAILQDPDKRYPWQNFIFHEIFDQIPTSLQAPDDRTIYWITDEEGCSGKSKFTKFCCVHNDAIAKLSFGSAQQLRSAVISAGAKELYILDMPRTLGEDDSLAAVMSVAEDIKNGFVVSSFYGQSSKLIMNPPHIVIFSNKRPNVKYLTSDRWRCYTIKNYNLVYSFENHDYYRLGFSRAYEGVRFAEDTE
jgi:hypothetical protein